MSSERLIYDTDSDWNAEEILFDQGQLIMELTHQPTVVTGSNQQVAVKHFDGKLKVRAAQDDTRESLRVVYSNIEVSCYIGSDTNLSEQEWKYAVVVNDTEDTPSDDDAAMPGSSTNSSQFDISGEVSNTEDGDKDVYIHFGNKNGGATAAPGVVYFFLSVKYTKTETVESALVGSGGTPGRLSVLTHERDPHRKSKGQVKRSK